MDMKFPLTLIICVLLFACNDQRIVTEQQLKDYIMDPENGLRKVTEKNGIDMEVIYKPIDLILAQQMDGVIDKQERMKTIDNFANLSYFIIKLSRKGQEIENAFVSDNDKFVRVINYLSSSIANNIYVVTEQD